MIKQLCILFILFALTGCGTSLNNAQLNPRTNIINKVKEWDANLIGNDTDVLFAKEINYIPYQVKEIQKQKKYEVNIYNPGEEISQTIKPTITCLAYPQSEDLYCRRTSQGIIEILIDELNDLSKGGLS